VLEFGQLPTISHLKLRQEVVGAIFYGWTYFPFASYHTCFLLYRVNINVVAWYILINWFYLPSVLTFLQLSPSYYLLHCWCTGNV